MAMGLDEWGSKQRPWKAKRTVVFKPACAHDPSLVIYCGLYSSLMWVQAFLSLYIVKTSAISSILLFSSIYHN